jgi:hypothetical protein
VDDGRRPCESLRRAAEALVLEAANGPSSMVEIKVGNREQIQRLILSVRISEA